MGLVPACGSGEEITRELYELERLAFVPQARFKLVALGDPNADCSMSRAIVIDRFEFTLRDRGFYEDGGATGRTEVPGDGEAAFEEDEELDRPAPLDFYEARAFAQARGMRLPRAKEWIHVAVGRKELRYPWGGKSGRFANTSEIALGRSVRVGTFENGRVEPFGCYDMLGNVWEWVADEAPSYFPQLEPAGGELTSVMGGGFDSKLDSLYGRIHQRLRFYALTLPKRARSPAYGARMCADAEDYFWAKSGSWGRGAQARARVVAVGRRWARDDIARDDLEGLLEDLLAREGAPEGLSWLHEGLSGFGEG